MLHNLDRICGYLKKMKDLEKLGLSMEIYFMKTAHICGIVDLIKDLKKLEELHLKTIVCEKLDKQFEIDLDQALKRSKTLKSVMFDFAGNPEYEVEKRHIKQNIRKSILSKYNYD